MGFLLDLYNVFVKSLLGESEQEKEYRHILDDSKKLYDLGWQYGKKEDLKEASKLAERLLDDNAPSANHVFKKYRLLAMINIKQVALVLKNYKLAMKNYIEHLQNLNTYDVAKLESDLENISQQMQAVRSEIDKILTMPQSRKHDNEITAKEAIFEDLRTQQQSLSDKIREITNLNTKIEQLNIEFNNDIEKYAQKLMKYFSAAKEVSGLNSEEKVRRDLLLKSNWTEFKQIQSDLEATQAEYANILNAGDEEDLNTDQDDTEESITSETDLE